MVFHSAEKFIESDQPSPVLVWIHGGGMVSGSGTFNDYGPQFFIDEDVILVSINYRLGPFGFLTTTNNEIPGNMGHWDQALALRWVNQNIHHFGGDTNQDTGSLQPGHPGQRRLQRRLLPPPGCGGRLQDIREVLEGDCL